MALATTSLFAGMLRVVEAEATTILTAPNRVILARIHPGSQF